MSADNYRSLADQTTSHGPVLAAFVTRYLDIWRNYKDAWNYEDGCIWKGALELAAASGLRFPSDFVYREISLRVSADGSIRNYRADEFNIDNVNPGMSLLALYRLSGEARFLAAADQHIAQLESHPRTQSGNFWHKQIYPHQVWLDGLYMAQPFRLGHARLNQRDDIIDDAIAQFRFVHATLRNAASGLLYHGWDESRSERWSNPETGNSPNFWGRAMGWYVMALADSIDALGDDPRASVLADILRDAIAALLRVRTANDLWLQVLDRPDVDGNYEEASASLMIAYALMKGARLGVLDDNAGAIGERAFATCVQRFVTPEQLNGICGIAGLGNTPYRDGSVEYYLSEKITPNDPKGVAALLMALSEALRRR